MMKRSLGLVVALIALTAAALHADNLADCFTNPPAEARPWVYWHWMNGNVTREGIRADMQAFADVGVGGTLTFDIGIHPAGPVTNRSPEWYDLIKFATAEATKHGIKMSFHCPGWSAAGGPWITPELGMQELTWSETVVEGPREFTVTLPQPPTRLDFYRDAAVIAFPTPAGDEPLPKPQLTDATGKPLPAGTTTLPGEFDLVFPQSVDARSVLVRVGRATGDFQAGLSAFDEHDGKFRPVATFRSHISGPFSAHIGSASFAPVRAGRFRMAFDGRSNNQVVIEQLELHAGYRLPGWTSKAGFATDRVEPRPATPTPLPADVVALNKIVDLTGKQTWSVPAGRWTILRIGHTPTGVHIAPAPLGGDGLECDRLSREATDFHYGRCVTPVLRELGPELTKQAVAYYHVDSYEAGWQNWSAKFPQEFGVRRGYDLTKYLPALTGRVVGDLATTEKFLWDFRRTIGDLYADNHYGRLAQRCHADGLGFSTEPYGGPFEFLQVGTRADHPMIEFWLPTKPEGKKPAFDGVFAGHMAGRQIIGAEAFTSGPPEEKWNSHPFSLKALGDFIWTAGVNRFVIHVSAHQPFTDEHLKPGLTCGINGIHFDRGNTWFSQGRAWIEYLTRSQAMLQQGQHVADVLYYQGDDSPNGVGPFHPQLPEGYDFDACGGETLAQLQVKDGRIVLPHGKSYRYLVLPGDGRMTAASLARIVELAQAGATVIGSRPGESPSLADASRSGEIRRLRELLGGDAASSSGVRSVGKGRMIWGRSFEQILADDNLAPDVAFDPDPQLPLHAVHRQVGDTDIYFVANASHRSGEVKCTFRVSGKTPELWYADTGRMIPAAVYEPMQHTTRLPLYFEPAGSIFVVFRPTPPNPLVTEMAFTPPGPSSKPSELRIIEATYGPPGRRERCIDVTQQVSARVKDNQLNLRNFESLAGDPAPGVRKELRLRYTWNGEHKTIAAEDGQSLIIPAPDGTLAGELRRDGDQMVLRAHRAGRFTLKLSSGQTKTVDVRVLPDPVPAAGPWDLSFPPGWGAPSRVQIEKLISWPDHPDPGIRFFSGTATYRTVLEIPADRFAPGRNLQLDLGDVQVIAEVKFNGQDMGVLWKPPFTVDVTGVAKPGRNELEVRVTNLWPNRLIGDEQFPDDCAVKGPWPSGGIRTWPEWLLKKQPRPEPRRQTFFAWKHWNKDDALLPSGLLGPVSLNTVESAEVK